MGSRRKCIKARVEQLLRAEWQACCIAQDGDGDFPFRNETAAVWVSVSRHKPYGIRVFGYAAADVKPSLRLLRELNELQLAAYSASIALCGDHVVVSQTLSPHGLTKRSLQQALSAVAGVAADIGPMLAAMFDGRTPYPATESVDEDAA